MESSANSIKRDNENDITDAMPSKTFDFSFPVGKIVYWFVFT